MLIQASLAGLRKRVPLPLIAQEVTHVLEHLPRCVSACRSSDGEGMLLGCITLTILAL